MVRRKRRTVLRLTGTDWQKVAAAIIMLGGWWDARTKPDPRTEAVASLASTGAEVDVRMTERLDSLTMRLGRVERALRRPNGTRDGGPEHASPAPAQKPRGLFSGLRRIFFGSNDSK